MDVRRVVFRYVGTDLREVFYNQYSIKQSILNDTIGNVKQLSKNNPFEIKKYNCS